MKEKKIKIRDGFQGEKLISIPTRILSKTAKWFPDNQLYVTHIGYFPKAMHHYRNRPNGCEDDILFYCLQGKGYYMIDGVKFELHANQFIFIPATTKPLSYWADQEDPWTIYWVHFTGQEIDSFNRSLHINIDQPAYISYNEEGLKIWNKMYDSLSMGYSLENMIHTNLCLYHLIATFIYHQRYTQSPAITTDKDIVNKTIDYMKDHLGERITVDDMASMNRLSMSHFSKLFRISIGIPPIDYFIHLKMQKACQLLQTTNLRIKEIASLVGYDDAYYFSRIFKKSINISPEIYRATIKGL